MSNFRFWQIVSPPIGLTLLLTSPLVIAPTPGNSEGFVYPGFQRDSSGYFPPRQQSAPAGVEPPVGRQITQAEFSAWMNQPQPVASIKPSAIQIVNPAFQRDSSGYFPPRQQSAVIPVATRPTSQSNILGLPSNGRTIPIGRGESFTRFEPPPAIQPQFQGAIAQQPTIAPSVARYTLSSQRYARMIDMGCQDSFVPVNSAFVSPPSEQSGQIYVLVNGGLHLFDIQNGGVRCVGAAP